MIEWEEKQKGYSIQILKSIGSSQWISLAHKTPIYDLNMLPKVDFDKTGFSNLKLVIT